MWAKYKGTAKYERWIAYHVCHINHTQSSGAMETAHAVAMFKWSVEKNGLIYHVYLGDGDTSSYKDVASADPYKEEILNIAAKYNEILNLLRCRVKS